VLERKPFPDIEAALVELLSDLATCGTVTPPNLDSSLPFIRIMRYGGNDDLINDSARIDIDAFGQDRASSYELGEAIRQRLLAFPFSLTNCVIDKVTSNTGPMEIPWGDANVRRRNASYTVICRRPL
jgi:hypothetical protein